MNAVNHRIGEGSTADAMDLASEPAAGVTLASDFEILVSRRATAGEKWQDRLKQNELMAINSAKPYLLATLFRRRGFESSQSAIVSRLSVLRSWLLASGSGALPRG